MNLIKHCIATTRIFFVALRLGVRLFGGFLVNAYVAGKFETSAKDVVS